MKRSLTFIITLILAVFISNINVYADASMRKAIEGQDSESLVNELKSEYESGFPTLNISSSQLVGIYGKSECSASTGSCTWNFQGDTDDIEELLVEAVNCTNGEGSINYSYNGSVATDYKQDYSGTEDITVYWEDIYYVSCVSSSSSGDNVVDLEGTGSSSNGSSSNGSSSNGSTGNDYSSSTSTNSPETGVETYYIVLGVIAIMSYSFMLIAKKRNFFKKI